MRRVIPLLAVAVLAAPPAARAASVVRVTAGASAVRALVAQGFDVTENVRDGHADVVVYSRAEVRRLRAAGFAFRRLPRVRDRAVAAGGGRLKRKNCAADTPAEAHEPCRDRAGVDLNRNYGAGWGGPGASASYFDDDYRGSGPWSEPETRAVHELSQGLQITGLET